MLSILSIVRHRLHVCSRHEIMWSLLEQKPLSRLGKLSRARSHEAILELAEAYSLDKNEIYFDRDPHMFTSILDYYRCYSVDIHISHNTSTMQ